MKSASKKNCCFILMRGRASSAGETVRVLSFPRKFERGRRFGMQTNNTVRRRQPPLMRYGEATLPRQDLVVFQYIDGFPQRMTACWTPATRCVNHYKNFNKGNRRDLWRQAAAISSPDLRLIEWDRHRQIFRENDRIIQENVLFHRCARANTKVAAVVVSPPAPPPRRRPKSVRDVRVPRHGKTVSRAAQKRERNARVNAEFAATVALKEGDEVWLLSNNVSCVPGTAGQRDHRTRRGSSKAVFWGAAGRTSGRAKRKAAKHDMHALHALHALHK